MTPDIYTNQELFLEVGDGHTLYVHDWGNKEASAIFHLHGGPGSGCKDSLKNNYDPSKQRVIFHDQRGNGRSTPLSSRSHNTTQKLINDISAIAEHLDIETFALSGYSWGSTLCLAYAIDHPERVTGIVTGGIWLGTQEEVDWAKRRNVAQFFPETWQIFLDRTPADQHERAVAYHQDTALHSSQEAQKQSTYALECLESSIGSLDDRPTLPDYDTYDPSKMLMEIAYTFNNCFLPENHIINNAHKLTMPVYIVQGRYGMVCLPETAHKLHQVLPNSELYWMLSGHRPEHEGWSLLKSLSARATQKISK